MQFSVKAISSAFAAAKFTRFRFNPSIVATFNVIMDEFYYIILNTSASPVPAMLLLARSRHITLLEFCSARQIAAAPTSLMLF